jgi:endo-alpha-1,4-polygalactosaminidase (GH114 family)
MGMLPMIRTALLSLALFALTADVASSEPWQPAPGTSFEWILQRYKGTIPDQEVIDVDLFDTPKGQIDNLKAHGKKAICYISVGSWENWRPDKKDFPESVIGKPLDGWPGERWLDIRQIDLLAPVLGARFDLCKTKGFDAIEPDNLDGFQAKTGFPIARADTLAYLHWLSDEAHERGLSIGLKNVPELVPDVLDDFDWAMTEECFDQGWCSKLKPFIAGGKAVFAVEYVNTGVDFSAFCAKAEKLNLSPLLKRRSLMPWSQQCP